MIYHGFQGGNGFQPSHMLRLGLSFTGGTDIDGEVHAARRPR